MKIVGIIHEIGIGVASSHIDLQPTVYIALIVDICQTAAIPECIVADACHAVPNRNACQTAAI